MLSLRSPLIDRLSPRRLILESNSWIFLALLAMVAIFSAISPANVFLTPSNLVAIAISGAEVLILAVGSTFVIITGSIDLSIGSVLVCSSVLGIDVMTRAVQAGAADWGAILAGVAVALVIGAGIGVLNGLLTTRLRMPSFIVTLGTLGIALGVAQLFTVGSVSKTAPDLLVRIGLSSVAGVPAVVVVAILTTLPAALVLARTKFGLHCYAVGSNREAARRAGVHVNHVLVSVFVLNGFLAALAGVVDIARFSSASVAGHQSDNLAAIAAVIIGGTSLFGGRGSIWGTVVGTLIPVVLLQGLVIQAVNPYWQSIAIGVVLIVAVAVDQLQRERLARGESFWRRPLHRQGISAGINAGAEQRYGKVESARPTGARSD